MERPMTSFWHLWRIIALQTVGILNKYEQNRLLKMYLLYILFHLTQHIHKNATISATSIENDYKNDYNLTEVYFQTYFRFVS